MAERSLHNYLKINGICLLFQVNPGMEILKKLDGSDGGDKNLENNSTRNTVQGVLVLMYNTVNTSHKN